MADLIEHAPVQATTTADLAEVTVAVAAVLSRCAGTDRAVVSVHTHDTGTKTGSAGRRLWRAEVPMPRGGSVREVLAAMPDSLTVNVSLTLYVTVMVSDPAGRRRSARIEGDVRARTPGSATWLWLTGGGADPTDDDRVRRVLRQVRMDPDTRMSDLPVLRPGLRGPHRPWCERHSGPAGPRRRPAGHCGHCGW